MSDFLTSLERYESDCGNENLRNAYRFREPSTKDRYSVKAMFWEYEAAVESGYKKNSLFGHGHLERSII